MKAGQVTDWSKRARAGTSAGFDTRHPAFIQVARKQKGSTFPEIPPGPGAERGLRDLKTPQRRAWALPWGRKNEGHPGTGSSG